MRKPLNKITNKEVTEHFLRKDPFPHLYSLGFEPRAKYEEYMVQRNGL
jgi:hypothetical protein